MRGSGLILLLFLVTGFIHYSRWAFPEREASPAVLRLNRQQSTLAVADSQGLYGLYQFNDGSTLLDVIKMTGNVSGPGELLKSLSSQPAISGELIKVPNLEGEIIQIERSWLSARHRILLQIPLHPDRMTLQDWETLPGIGPKLATTIEIDRQKNGDFKDFNELDRVQGIGFRKLEGWKRYFMGEIHGTRK